MARQSTICTNQGILTNPMIKQGSSLASVLGGLVKFYKQCCLRQHVVSGQPLDWGRRNIGQGPHTARLIVTLWGIWSRRLGVIGGSMGGPTG